MVRAIGMDGNARKIRKPKGRAVSVLPGHTVALTVTVQSQSTELNIGKLNRGYDVAIKSLLQV